MGRSTITLNTVRLGFSIELLAPFLSYCVYTSLMSSEIGENPPKSPLKRGTKIRILAPCLVVFLFGGNPRIKTPLSKGFGGFGSQNEVNHTCVYAIASAEADTT